MTEERKLVTILFADVAGSTELGDALDPEDVRAIMGRYYAHARQAVSHHGGTLEKFIGDAVMAIFGLPVAHGDDAERAIAAALALRDAVAADPALNGTGAIHLRLRVGVNTGEVVATSDLSGGDFLITGDAVNVAARIEQHALPGEVLGGERSYMAARYGFLFDEPRRIEAKGKPLPLKVYPVSGPREQRLRERLPIVGRKADLAQLALLQARVLEDRRPHLLTLVAPAGTGKTRILEEFLTQIDPAVEFQTAVARCLPYGQVLSFLPLQGMIDNFLGGTATTPIIAAALERSGYPVDEAETLAQLIRATLGGESEIAQDREAAFNAWRLLLEAGARQAPLVLIFEDIHWASETLLDLIDHLTMHCKDTPILILALSRPELLDRRPNWGGGRQNSVMLALQPLATAQTTALLAMVLPEWPAAALTRIAEQSGGNPFFALEIAHGLAERGVDASAATPLPDTVHEAVLARLDRLDGLSRAVIQVAAVASRVVQPKLIAALLPDVPPAAIVTALDQLIARDLLIQPEAGRYNFRHILIRDVAYGLLARQERIKLHSALASWLEATEDPPIELIAFHYREAVLLSRQSAIPSVLPFPIDHAVAALRQAGARAGYAGAFAEASQHYRDALALAEPEAHVAINEEFGDALPGGDTAYSAYRTAFTQWQADPAGDPAIGVRLTRKMTSCLWRTFIMPELSPSRAQVLAELAAALELAASAELTEERHHLLITRLGYLANTSALPPPELLAEVPPILALIEYYTDHHKEQIASEALDAITLVYMSNGMIAETYPLIELRLTLPHPSARERFDAFSTLGALHFVVGDYQEVITTARRALAMLRPEHSPIFLISTISMAMIAAYYSGDWDVLEQFVPLIESVVDQTRFDPSIAINLGDCYIMLLLVALAREDRPRIDACLATLRRVMGSLEAVQKLVTAFRDDDLGELSRSLGEWQGMMILESMMYLNEHGIAVRPEIIAKAGDPRMALDIADRARAVATALYDQDNAKLAAAISAAEGHQLTLFAARMWLVLADQSDDARYLAGARPVLARVQDHRSLRRLHEIAARLGAL